MNPAVSFCVHSLRLKARTAAEATQSRHGTDPSFFQFPAMGIAQLFPQTAASAPPWTARAYTAAPRKGGAAQSVWSLSGTAGGNGFQQILPAQGRADGLGAVVAPGRRAEGGQSFFLLYSCPYCRLRLFPGQDPLSGRPSGGGKTVSPDIPRRRSSLSGKPPAGFQARSQFLKGNGSIQTEAHPVFLFIW